MTTIYVDADACPVARETIKSGRARHVPVVVVGNESQNLARFESERGVQVLRVGTGPDAADFAIAPRLARGDVVVTQDIGLAAMALGRGAEALTPRGQVFSRATIEGELEVRYAQQKHRGAGGRTRGPAPYVPQDRERFSSALARLLDGALEGGPG